MTAREAVRMVRQRFPFPGYMPQDDTVYVNSAARVLRYVRPGEEILDFGAGPCDKLAILRVLGYRCTACDDLSDHWHLVGENRQRILDFAAREGIAYQLIQNGLPQFARDRFAMIVLEDVLEHLHESPRELLNTLLESLRPGGYLFVTVPNAVNIRKRLAVLCGRTNYGRYDVFYWYPGRWRGHVREYTREDLRQLAGFLGLRIVELDAMHTLLDRLPRWARPVYRAVTAVFHGWRDSWVLVAQKPAGWQPLRSLSPEALGRVIGQCTHYAYDGA